MVETKTIGDKLNEELTVLTNEFSHNDKMTIEEYHKKSFEIEKKYIPSYVRMAKGVLDFFGLEDMGESLQRNYAKRFKVDNS